MFELWVQPRFSTWYTSTTIALIGATRFMYATRKSLVHNSDRLIATCNLIAVTHRWSLWSWASGGAWGALWSLYSYSTTTSFLHMYKYNEYSIKPHNKPVKTANHAHSERIIADLLLTLCLSSNLHYNFTTGSITSRGYVGWYKQWDAVALSQAILCTGSMHHWSQFTSDALYMLTWFSPRRLLRKSQCKILVLLELLGYHSVQALLSGLVGLVVGHLLALNLLAIAIITSSLPAWMDIVLGCHSVGDKFTRPCLCMYQSSYMIFVYTYCLVQSTACLV